MRASAGIYESLLREDEDEPKGNRPGQLKDSKEIDNDGGGSKMETREGRAAGVAHDRWKMHYLTTWHEVLVICGCNQYGPPIREPYQDSEVDNTLYTPQYR